MVAIVLIHMCQVFLFGAYKFPRELTWILGVFLLLMTLGHGLHRAGDALRSGLRIGDWASALPSEPRAHSSDDNWLSSCWAVPSLRGLRLLVSSPCMSSSFRRLMLAFASLHTWLVLKLGINEWPTPGRLVKRETYIQEYNELSHTDGMPFVPGAVWKDAMFAAGIVLAVPCARCSSGRWAQPVCPDPTIVQTVPKPDYFFLWIYSALAFLPPSIETPMHAHCAGDRQWPSCWRCLSLPGSARRAGTAARWQ